MEMALLDVRRDEAAPEASTEGDGVSVTLQTSRGEILGRFHAAPAATRAVVWVGGAGGGLDGPARGLYPTLARDLAAHHGIASLRLHYRQPNHLEECVLDTLMGAEWLRASEDVEQVALVGHSFGGAVVIAAGALSETVAAVAPLSTQTYGAGSVGQLAPRPVLFLHGEADEILPPTCSTSLYARAGHPKAIKIYPGARHGLDECREELIADLRRWLLDSLIPR